MPTSVVTFESLNVDPLPSASLITAGVYTSFAYGTVVGGDTALDTKDTTSSYVTVGDFGSGHQAITCRPVITPPIPAGAFIRPGGFVPIRDDFEATLEQVAFFNSPPVPGFGGSDVAPDFRISRASDGLLVAVSIGEGRGASDPWWNADWWDETNLGTNADPPAWTSSSALTQPAIIAYLDPTDYLVIWYGGPNLLISQFVGQITWEPGAINWHNAFGHYAAAGSVALQIYTPPNGWVDIVDGPA